MAVTLALVDVGWTLLVRNEIGAHRRHLTAPERPLLSFSTSMLFHTLYFIKADYTSLVSTNPLIFVDDDQTVTKETKLEVEEKSGQQWIKSLGVCRLDYVSSAP